MSETRFALDSPQACSASAEPAENGIVRLVQEHHASVYRFAYRLTGCQADAEDLTQQTYLLAQQNLHQLREPAAARGWLFSIARNCFSRAVRQRLRIRFEPGEVDVQNLPAAEESVEVDAEALQTALDDLPDNFRVCVLMYYFEELAYQEIADRLCLPLGTVMSRLSRAKGHLRKRLFEHASYREVQESEPSADSAPLTSYPAVQYRAGKYPVVYG